MKLHNPFNSLPGYCCYGCAPPDKNFRGLGMEFRREGDKVVSDWMPREEFQGFSGVIHGGIQATLLDEIASWFVFVIEKTAGVTGRLEVNYLNSARLDKGPFRLEASRSSAEGKNVDIAVSLRDAVGTVCSEGIARYVLFSEGLAKKKLDYPGSDKFLQDGDASGRRGDPLLDSFRSRRSVRKFSTAPVDLNVVRDCIALAATAPSGANCQPWTFALVSSHKKKREIRKAAEKVESRFYESSSTRDWREDLSDLRTGADKAFLEDAPCLIVLFLQKYGRSRTGKKINHYYPGESLGLAAGFLMSALHLKGLSTLPYTPAPMNFLMDILDRPENERPYLILPVGYPADDWVAPDLGRKPLEKIIVEYKD